VPPQPAEDASAATTAAERRAALREQMAERNRRLAVEADRDKTRDAVLTALSCLLWMGAGVFLVLWSFHTTDMAYGRAAFAGGIAVGNGGIIFTLLAFYRRGEARGDW